VTVPDTAVERQALKARADLMQDFTKQVEGGKLDPTDGEAVDVWLRGRLKNVKAGANTRSFLETLKGADGASADLLPPIGWKDAAGAIDKVLGPTTVGDPVDLPSGAGGMDEDGLVKDLLRTNTNNQQPKYP
jgi:hypothetical protein